MPPADVSAVHLDHLSFTYRNSTVQALDDVSVSFLPGKIYLILGRTGSGKTSLVRTFNGIIPSFFKGRLSGFIEIAGQGNHERPVSQWAATIGMVLQDFESQLFSTNATCDLVFGPENLCIPPEIIQTRTQIISQKMEISHLLDRDPSTLSGGQKQRLAIASVLMLDPPILIFDEPATDLDPEGQMDIYSLIQELRSEGKTIFLIEHNTDIAGIADETVIMKSGKIEAHGPTDRVVFDMDLFDRCDLMKPAVFHALNLLNIPCRTSDVRIAADRIVQHGFQCDMAAYTAKIEEESVSTTTDPIVSVRNLSFGYDDRKIIDNQSCTIYRQDFIALIGQNGSGKTTLAKLIDGILTPDSGEVVFHPESVTNPSTAGKTRRTGYVFQNPDHQIFNPTVYDEIAFGLIQQGVSADEIQNRVLEVMETAGLENRESADPFVLPKGDRQRVAVASILVLKPEILILDEPTTGLDHHDQIAMMDLLSDLNRSGHTIIIITHSMHVVVKYAQRALVMSQGRIIADLKTRQLFQEDTILKQANLSPPPIVQLSRQFGMVCRDALEFSGLMSSGKRA